MQDAQTIVYETKNGLSINSWRATGITLPEITFNAEITKYRTIFRLGCHSHFPLRFLRLIVVHVSLQFADSWSACITQSQSNSLPSSNSTPTSSSNPEMSSFRGVVGTLANFLLSPSKDAGHRKLQVSCSLLMPFKIYFSCVTHRPRVILEGHGCVTKFQSCVLK